MQEKYDVIIIGGGISGLICGNYLAKFGHKTLLIEKEHQVGGYCTSFSRGGFFFDSCVHSIGSCRKDGVITTLLKEIGIFSDHVFVRSDPSDIVIVNEEEFYIYNDIGRCVNFYENTFPKEKTAIKHFFSFITDENPARLYSKINKKDTYSELLDNYFDDNRLKAVLKMFSGNLGLPSHMIPAVTAVTLLREHVFDGGYYPCGGMQCFSNLLMSNFVKHGGKVLLGSEVREIICKNSEAIGVALKNSFNIDARYIVAACDMKQVLSEFVNEGDAHTKYIDVLRKRLPSVSGFTVYLGLDSRVNDYFRRTRANIWYSKNYDIDEQFENLINGDFDNNGTFVFCSSSSLKDESLQKEQRDSMELMILAPYISENYWLENRDKVKKNVLRRAAMFMPELEKKIIVADCATPITLNKYTHNQNGALYGWSSIKNQVGVDNNITRLIDIGSLYFTGHWAGLPSGYGGIVNVAYSGKNIAQSIIKKSVNRGVLV